MSREETNKSVEAGCAAGAVFFKTDSRQQSREATTAPSKAGCLAGTPDPFVIPPPTDNGAMRNMHSSDSFDMWDY